MKTIHSVIAQACEILHAGHPRAAYAQDVLKGRHRWSGSDLKGKARRYCGSYARSRIHARCALQLAGGEVLATGHSGFLRSAVYVGMDDYGTAIYSTRAGPMMPRGKRCYRVQA